METVERFWVEILALVMPTLHLVGALHAAHALMSVRTAQGTVAWMVTLVLFPYLAVPMYWVFGRNKFQGYIGARREVDERLKAVAPEAEPDPEGHVCDRGDRFSCLCAKLGGLPPAKGNAVELLIGGAEGFESMLGAIGMAKDYVLLETFIVKEGRVGERFREALVRKAREGVRVYFLYDEFGSRKLSKGFRSELEAEGIELRAFGANRGPGNRLQINFRNHRKIMVVDNRVAFVGGLNVGDEYLGRIGGGKPWRDTHLMVRGGAVTSLQRIFLEDWYWATREVPDLDWGEAEADDGDKEVLVVPTGPSDPVDSCQLFFIGALSTAAERVWIASPYFVPDQGVVAALSEAALRGVDVRILLPGEPDHLLVWLSSFSYFEEMERAGVKIFRYREGFLHQKVLLVDSTHAAVGTANLDNRSFRLNFEVMALVTGAGFAGEVEEMLVRDFEGSRRVSGADYSERGVVFRAGCRLARLLAPVQ